MGRRQIACLLLLGMGACRFDPSGVNPGFADAMTSLAPAPDAAAPDAALADAQPGDGTAGPIDGSPGASGWALRFDGNGDYFAIEREIDADFTIEAWIRTTASRSGSQFFEGLGLFYADLSGVNDDFGASILNGRFAFGTGNPDTTVQSTTQVTTGQWVHVAAVRVRSQGVIQVFVNGNQEASTDGASDGNLDEPERIDIGSNNVDSGRAFQGDIDELRIWDAARSPAQIQATMNVRLTGDEPDLAGYWPMDDGPGAAMVTDSGPRENHGVLGGGNADLSPTFVPSDAPIDS